MRRLPKARVATVAAVTALATIGVATYAAANSDASRSPAAHGRVAVRAMVFTMFSGETATWLANEPLKVTAPVPAAYSPVRCTRAGLCVAEIGQGKSNAASSVMAILDSRALDFSKAYFITSGIAGTSPKSGTLGFAAWARYVVDFDLGHHFVPADAPGVPHGFLPLGFPVGTEVYRLNESLVRSAYQMTRHVKLADSKEAVQTRRKYAGQAKQHPFVAVCDTVTGDNYWAGAGMEARARYVVKLETKGAGRYCTTQMEDNATATALARHGYLSRYLSLRTASDFDLPYPGESLQQLVSEFPGFTIAAENAYRVASTVAHHFVAAS